MLTLAGLLPQEPIFEGINPNYPYPPELEALVALQEYTSTTDSYTESEVAAWGEEEEEEQEEQEEEEEEEYNEYMHLDPNDFSDGPGEVSDSSSHGSKPLQYSEPSVHGEGYSDYYSPSPGPPSERRRKRLRDGADTPNDQDRAADGHDEHSDYEDPLSPVSKMPKFDE